VILVTHSANNAVVGDSELILPMFRENDCGKAKDPGSIDTSATKQCVMDILEGGRMRLSEEKKSTATTKVSRLQAIRALMSSRIPRSLCSELQKRSG